MSFILGANDDPVDASSDKVINYDVMKKIDMFRRMWGDKFLRMPIMNSSDYNRVINQIKIVYNPQPQSVRNQLLSAQGKILMLEEQLKKAGLYE